MNVGDTQFLPKVISENPPNVRAADWVGCELKMEKERVKKDAEYYFLRGL